MASELQGVPAVTTANFKQSPLTCQECEGRNVVPPTDLQWSKGDGDATENWNTLALTNGHYRCPKCDKFELRSGTIAGGNNKIVWD
jgi:hypothetical protein